jgi:hypothetical protein
MWEHFRTQQLLNIKYTKTFFASTTLQMLSRCVLSLYKTKQNKNKNKKSCSAAECIFVYIVVGEANIALKWRKFRSVCIIWSFRKPQHLVLLAIAPNNFDDSPCFIVEITGSLSCNEKLQVINLVKISQLLQTLKYWDTEAFTETLWINEKHFVFEYNINTNKCSIVFWCSFITGHSPVCTATYVPISRQM